MDEHLAYLRGGSRDGESTTVPADLDRLIAASRAPGMVDVYQRTAGSEALPGNPDPAVVFEFVAQEPAGELGAHMLHMPPA